MIPSQILQEGLRLHQSGRLSEAESRYRQILAQEPRQPDALHYLGLIAYQNKRFGDAARLIGDSIAIKADNAAAHSNLGNALAMLGRLVEAEAAFRNALALDPQLADAWFNLGNNQREQNRYADADAAYRRVIALQPQHLGAINNLANLLLLNPERKAEAAEAFHYLGNVLQDVGRTADAASAYQQALAIAPNPGVEVKLAFLAPVIPMSVQEIDQTRERLVTGMAALTTKGIRLADPLRYASSAIFYTGYHGRNDRDLRKGFADFYLRASPQLAVRAPHCENYTGAGERIRIGFISRHFSPEHPMTKLYAGIIEHLDRRRFDVTVFRFSQPGAAELFADTRVTVLQEDLAAAREAMARARLDVLFYTDIGMDPTTYFLALQPSRAGAVRHLRPSRDDRHRDSGLLPVRAGNGNCRSPRPLHRDADPALDGSDIFQSAVGRALPAHTRGSGASRPMRGSTFARRTSSSSTLNSMLFLRASSSATQKACSC